MAQKKSGTQRFMNFTGKLRVIFGPAQKSSTDHPMTDENKELLKERQADAAQWETIRRADGSTYIVPKQH